MTKVVDDGFSLHFNREEWGIIYDGVILERAKALQRKAANPESTSDDRWTQCGNIMRTISQTAHQL